MLEAVCGECGETFIPDSEDDLIHVECGGRGSIVGTWSIVSSADQDGPPADM